MYTANSNDSSGKAWRILLCYVFIRLAIGAHGASPIAMEDFSSRRDCKYVQHRRWVGLQSTPPTLPLHQQWMQLECRDASADMVAIQKSMKGKHSEMKRPGEF